MSRQSEVEKVYSLIKSTPVFTLYWVGANKENISKQDRESQLWATAEYLVDSGIGSKDRFEVEWDYKLAEFKNIVPINYKGEK